MSHLTPLQQAFDALQPPSETGREFTVAAWPGRPGAYAGRSREGLALLVEVSETSAVTSQVRLKNLDIRPAVRANVEIDGQTSQKTLAVCLCTAADRHVRRLFVDALECVLPTPGPVSAGALRDALEGLIELFTVLAEPAHDSVLGVWGELAAICLSSAPDEMLNAWHTSPTERYDFAHGQQRLEVKTTTGRRHHHLSLEQLEPPEGVSVVLASIVTEASSAGMTVMDLVCQAAQLCTAVDARPRLLLAATRALGAGMLESSDARFDLATAKASLRLVRSEDVPRPVVEDGRVWGVRFQADFEGLPSANGATLCLSQEGHRS